MTDGISRRELLAGTAAGVVAAGASLVPQHAVASLFQDPAPRVDPTRNPCDLYPGVPEIDCETFRLGAGGLSKEQHDKALQQLLAYQTHRQSKTLGFQANQQLAYENDLRPFLDFHINNVGDPFQAGSFTLNSKWMERAVLDYYAQLWNARWPHDAADPESYWGYVLTMGSTEGNLYGLWNARDYLQGKCLLYEPTSSSGGDSEAASQPPRRMIYHQAIAPADNPHAFTPVAFYSEDTHYSIVKAMRVLGMHTFYEIGTNDYPGQCPITTDGNWPMEVPSQGAGGGPGTIDVDALAELVEFFASRGYPIIVSLNYGTTFKGAYDDVEQVGRRLEPILKKYRLWERTIADVGGHRVERTGYWIHVDGALAASYMPFVEQAYQARRIDQRGPNFDFRLPFVHSMTMSGHKWIGAPWPCGVYMSKTRYLLLPPSRPNYIGSRDSTLAGSRNGFSAMILWDYLARHSYEVQIKKALRLDQLAGYAYQRLSEMKTDQSDLWVDRSPMSLTVRFRRPNPEIVFKYSLANESLVVDGKRRDYSHIYIMEHVTRELIDELIHDLQKPDAFAIDQPLQPMEQVDTESFVAEEFRPLLYVPEMGRGWH